MPPAEKILTLKATLLNCRPPIWRTLEVKASDTLLELHSALQAVFGWSNEHLWDFEAGKHRYTPDPEDGDRDAMAHELQKVLTRRGQKLVYTYDYGDNWQVELLFSGLGISDRTTRSTRR